MTDIYELPNQATGFHRKALHHLEQLDYLNAVPLLIKSYRLEQNLTVFDELIKSLLILNDRQTLQQVWQEFYPEMDIVYQSEPLGQFYAMSLSTLYPLPDSLLRLYQLRDHFVLANWELALIDDLIAQLNQRQQQEQRLQQAIRDNTLDTYIDSLYTAQPFEFLAFLKQLYSLELTPLLPFYLALLQHERVAQYIKSDVLHYLHFAKFNQPVTYRWFDTSHQIDLTSLSTYQEQASYQANCNVIQQYGEQENPHLVVPFIQQFTLHYLTLYPFFDEVFPEPTQWFHLFLHENQLDSPYEMELTTTQQRYFAYVVEELTQLFWAD